MTEKRVLLAALLSTMFLVLYGQLLTKQMRVIKGRSSEINQTQPGTSQASPAATAPQATNRTAEKLEPEETIVIGSANLKLEVGLKSGAVRSVSRFLHDSAGSQEVQLRSDLPIFRVRSSDAAPLSFKLMSNTQTNATFNVADSTHHNFVLSYDVNEQTSLVDVKFRQSNPAVSKEKTTVLMDTSWVKGDTLSDRYNRLELLAVHSENGKVVSHKRYFAPTRSAYNVPRGTNLFSLSERYLCYSIRSKHQNLSTTVVPSLQQTVTAQTTIELSENESDYEATVYIGPRSYFSLKEVGFEDAFPIGIIGKIGLILLWVLKAIAGVTKNYGVAMIVFAALVTCMMAPFTMLSFRSMRKMQQLKPEMDKIMARHKDDPQKANKEVFALYKEHKVSPLSGCLPMLLQMPIFIALFAAISHFVELRGKPFLWVKDLSLPDRLWQLPFTLPIIGSDLNVLPIIMAFAMFAQTKMSQKNISTSDQQTAALMSGPLMSVMFGIMFYQFPAGLVLYWLTNSLMSMAWYRLAN